MQVFPTHKTDAEYIQFIRRSYDITNRWKWRLVAVTCLFFATCLAFAVYMKVFPGQRALPTLNISVVEGLTAWIWGFVVGHFFTMMLWIPILHVAFVFQELRTWKLLLAYHDQLQKAGLLPAEASGKMEVDQKTTEG